MHIACHNTEFYCVMIVFYIHFPGHYCPAQTEFAEQYPCNNGTFNNNTGAQNDSSCTMCTPGYYCPSHGLTAPAGPCAGGWYCTLGSWTDKPGVLGNDSGSDCHCPLQSIGGKCKAGTYCPEGSSEPIVCDGGSYCATDELDAVSGPCDAGFYCSPGSTMQNPVSETFGDVCPQGNYCPENSPAPTQCPEGTYSDQYQNENISHCLPCTGGMYCGGAGNILPDDDCDVGWFCPAGSTVPQPPGNECLAGHECPQPSSAEVPCASGYYQPDVGQGSCFNCPPGMYCDQNEAIAEEQSGVNESSHGVVTPKICPAGYYCPEGTQTATQNSCPIGTFSNDTGLANSSQCTQCTPGYYCDNPNINEPTGQCFAGYYCTLGAIEPTPSANGGECPQGTYCVTGSPQAVDCPKGTYGSAARLTALADCTFCPSGEFCDSPGLSAPSGQCDEGFYCSNASEAANPVGQTYGNECPAGNYCPAGSGNPTACDAGTYNPLTRSVNISACVPCDPGKYCDVTGMDAVAGNCTEGTV